MHCVCVSLSSVALVSHHAALTRYRNLVPLLCGEALYLGIAVGVTSDAPLQLQRTSASATGFARQLWTRAPHTLSGARASVSIWNARKQLCVTLEAQFANAVE